MLQNHLITSPDPVQSENKISQLIYDYVRILQFGEDWSNCPHLPRPSGDAKDFKSLST